MKKHLIAAAVAAAVAVPAAAQVTVYGVIDMGYAKEDKPTANLFTVSTITNSGVNQSTASGSGGAYVVGGSSGLSSSRLGFRGEEDLGGGLKAAFVLETGLNQGNGSFLFGGTNRAANLSISGGFGRVTVGRQNALGKNHNDGYNAQAGGASFEQGMIAFEATRGEELGLSAAVSTKAITDRTSNGVTYVLPKIGDITISGQYAVTKYDTDTSAANEYEVTVQGISANYASGPLAIGVTHSKGENTGSITLTPTTASTSVYTLAGSAVETTLTQIGGKYSFGPATVFALHNSGKVKSATAGELDRDVSGYDIGVTYKMGAMTFLASMGKGEVDEGTTTITTVDLDGYSAQAHYALSKRTTAYILYGKSEADRAGASALDGKTDVTMLGLRHTF